MKQHFFPALRLTLASIVVFMGLYTLLIWAIAQAAPNKGKGETVSVNNKVVGYKLEGQNFTEDKYFNSRPSAVGYNAAGSGASNKGPSNPDYLKDVQNRIDTFMVHNPSIKKEDIPSELVTASGSGLDPDLSPQGAYVQVERIAKTRNIPDKKIKALIAQQIQKPLFGLFGPEKVNVLQLNIALDNLQ
ncbi:MAG: K(+)-transporting ATPase subunit C [Bacteroidota bacterium]|nr:K(+)-transporting ATPase subunit C [Bacteroidota bacterium]